jgi:hypothetical protein
MTTEEIKALIRKSIEIGRRSMVEELWDVDALSKGNGWDEDMMNPWISDINSVRVEEVYASIDLNSR